jgi:hypothetical protein
MNRMISGDNNLKESVSFCFQSRTTIPGWPDALRKNDKTIRYKTSC